MIQITVEARFADAEGAEVRVTAFTLSVNTHGCLLMMDSKPEEGQRMYLRNPTSGAEQPGRVVRAKRARDGSFAVAFEFDSLVPDFWSTITPPKDWLVAKR